MDVDKLFSALFAQYRDCQTYMDLGSVFLEGGDQVVSFRTCFAQTNNLFLSVEESKPPLVHTFWTNGKKVFTYRSFEPFNASKVRTDLNLQQTFFESSKRMRLPIYAPTLLLPELKNLSFGFFDNIFQIEAEQDEHYSLISTSRPFEIIRMTVRRSDTAILSILVEKPGQEKAAVKLVYSEVSFNDRVEHVFSFGAASGADNP